MADERSSMQAVLMTQPSVLPTGQAVVTPATTTTTQVPSFWEQKLRSSWTALCFIVFCTCSFLLGWHMKGWHFSAYYEAPGGGSYVGAKPASSTVQTPPDQMAQAASDTEMAPGTGKQ